MNLKQKRKLKLKLHQALRHSLYILRNFEEKENLRNDEELEAYINMTKDNFNDIITKIKKEIENIKMQAKYKKDEKVRFNFNGKELVGIIQVVDFGTFTDKNAIEYDILINDSVLYKHIKQDDILGKEDKK